MQEMLKAAEAGALCVLSKPLKMAGDAKKFPSVEQLSFVKRYYLMTNLSGNLRPCICILIKLPKLSVFSTNLILK